MKKVFKKAVVVILQWEARMILRKYKPKIIAITGTVGKTSTKDAVYLALSSAFFVRKNEKSFNSEIGVPLTILGCQNAWNNPCGWLKNILIGLGVIFFKNHYPKWLVLEIGVDAPNDIRNIGSWLKPDVAVLTKFATVPAHVEKFISPRELIEEKKKLIDYLKKDGVLIINNDDQQMKDIQTRSEIKKVTFGLTGSPTIKGSDYEIVYDGGKPQGITFKINYAGKVIPVVLHGILGQHQVLPVLAALSTAISQGVNVVTASQTLGKKDYLQPGRMHLLAGIKETTIIDDSYNSSPVAAIKAVETLGEIKLAYRKIAVLGDMLELGKYSVEQHKKLGKKVVGNCDYLIVIGVRAKEIAEGAWQGGMSKENIWQFEVSEEAGKYLQNFIQAGDVILVKGSQSIRTEKVVEEIMAQPEKKAKLLVRQEREWLKR